MLNIYQLSDWRIEMSTQSAAVRKEKTRKKERYGRDLSLGRRLLNQWDIQLMVIPAIIYIFIFCYIPMYGLLMSFQDFSIFKGFWKSPWVGLKHFKAFLAAPDFWNIMRNTVVISLLRIFFGFPAPIILALMLNEVRNRTFKRVIQTVSYLPHFLSWVIVSSFVFSILSVENGSLNLLLLKLNIIKEPISFLDENKYFWSIIVTTGIWKEIGFGSIVYLAAIAGIDPQLYEAASMDGASRTRQIFLITIPCILPVIILFLILAIGDLLSAGFEDLLLLGSNPIQRPVSDVIDTYVYRHGVKTQRFSYATAVGMFKAVISIGLLAGANKLAKKTGNSLW